MKARAGLKYMETTAANVKLSDWVELTKPRIAVMSLITTLAGFYMASEVFRPVPAFHVLLGTALVAAGASAFNHLLERDRDALMERTRNRPLPSQRMTINQVLGFGLVTSVVGIVYLGINTNLLAAFFGALTLTLYVFVYTPLKRVTTLNTLIGAVPGALPPLIGWTAASGSLSAGAWVIFGILFLWQIPHFMAIAWLYREEYARAGFKMLPVADLAGRRTARQVFFQSLALLGISLLPTWLDLTGMVYFAAALALGLAFWGVGLFICFRRNDLNARRLLLASVIYLPLLLAFMVMDKA